MAEFSTGAGLVLIVDRHVVLKTCDSNPVGIQVSASTVAGQACQGNILARQCMVRSKPGRFS